LRILLIGIMMTHREQKKRLCGKSFILILPLVILTTVALTGCQTILETFDNTQNSQPTVDQRVLPKQGLTTHQRLAREGLDFLLQDQLTKASEKFNQALQLNPRTANYHFLNALAYHLIALDGDDPSYSLAQNGYELSIKFDSSAWLPRYFFGQLLIERKLYPQAAKQFAEALLLKGEEPDLMMGMAVAAYYSHDLETAAAMIDRLMILGKLESNADFQNGAIILASVDRSRDAKHLIAKINTDGNEQNGKLQHLQNRVKDWGQLYDQAKKGKFSSRVIERTKPKPMLASSIFRPMKMSYNITQASFDDESDSDEGEEFGAEEQSDSEEPLQSDLDTKMVVVDVVIIRTEENITTSKGINLLDGLTLQFGDTTNSLPAYGKTFNDAFVDSTGDVTRDVSNTITRALNIPAITYSLNIANATSARNEILARPTIVATSGKTSEFFSGVELNAAAASGGDGGGEPINIEKKIGVKLKVLPQFREDGRLNMEISAERTFLQSPSSDVIFTFRLETSKTTVDANVIMRFGETLILSGLSEKEAESTRDGTPLLQEVPWLQYLFSRHLTVDFQKSVLILITPRPAQYTYQPDKARKEHEKTLSEDDRSLASLRARYSDWFKSYPNWASIFKQMQGNSLYREFRTGDVELEKWHSAQSLKDRLPQAVRFFWY
jgi:Tfp pilus assembly protein PilF